MLFDMFYPFEAEDDLIRRVLLYVTTPLTFMFIPLFSEIECVEGGYPGW